MSKKILSFLILSFLSLQTISFFHLAEYGFEEHNHSHEHEHEHENENENKHDKDVCEIYLYCDQTKDNNYNQEKLVQGVEDFTLTFILDRNFFFYSKKNTLISTRAPPQSS